MKNVFKKLRKHESYALEQISQEDYDSETLLTKKDILSENVNIVHCQLFIICRLYERTIRTFLHIDYITSYSE